MKHRTQLSIIGLACITQGLLVGCGGGADTVANPLDTTPSPFAFVDQIDVDQSTLIESNSIAITGIDAPATLSVIGGEYSINGGSFTSGTGSISNGQTVVTRLTSASSANATVDAVLNIGGVTDTFSVTTLADTTPPTASISFPPHQSLTDGSTVTVRGTANDDLSDISAIRVNGVLASSTDGFASWSASVSLSHGDNNLIVETEDVEQNINVSADQVVIDRSTNPFDNPKALLVDDANNRALVLDRPNVNTIFAVDLDSGERTIFSSDTFPNSNNAFFNPTAISLDTPGNRALVVDASSTILAVDLSTGARSILTSDTTPNSINLFSGTAIAVDSANDRALVVSRTTNVIGYGVFAVDLVTGERTILSDGVTPNSNTLFSLPTAIVVDATNSRALVVDVALNAVISVDLASGARTVLSDNTTPDAIAVFGAASDIALDANNNRALVLDRAADALAVIAVDLDTGARSVLSSDNVPNSNNSFRNPGAIGLDASNGRALVAENGLGATAIFGIDLNSGQRSVLSDSATPDGTNWLVDPKAIAIDSVSRRALVIDSRFDQSVFRDRNAVFAIDLDNGARTVLSDDSTPDATNPLLQPQGIVLHQAENQALVVDLLPRTVLAVDLASGARTVLSNDATPNSGIPLSQPLAIALDESNNRALVADVGYPTVLAVDLNSGARTIFTNEASFPIAIAIDDPGNRALMIDDGLNGSIAVYALDLTSGARTILSDNTTPSADNPLQFPFGITIDSVRNRAIVANQIAGLIAVDLDTGARTVLSDNVIPNSNNPFSSLSAIAMDEQSDLILVVDQRRAAIVAVDPVSGERVILSQD